VTKWEAIATKHLEGGEVLRGAVPAFSGGGFGRLVIGVTDRRLLMIKSSYTHFKDRGLLWADDVSKVRLSGDVIKTTVRGAQSGNAYTTLVRADGTDFKLNVRRGFLFFPQSDRHLRTLYALLPARA
jgi:hypothetical protein